MEVAVRIRPGFGGRGVSPVAGVRGRGAGPGWEHACKRGWGSFHPAGFNFLVCDGSVHFIPETIDVDVFGQLATIAGGETASLP